MFYPDLSYSIISHSKYINIRNDSMTPFIIITTDEKLPKMGLENYKILSVKYHGYTGNLWNP